MPQAHGHAPPGHAAGGIGLRNGLESFTRLLVPERVEHGNSTLKLRLHSGGTGGRELNCANLSHVTEISMDWKALPASSYQNEWSMATARSNCGCTVAEQEVGN